jgi:hypothetical protein
VGHVEAENLRPTPLLTVSTALGSTMKWSGVQSDRPSHGRPLPLASSPTAAASDGLPTDPLQLLTPAEAARIAGVKVHTLRSWDVAGRLPHTQLAPDGGTRRHAIQDLRRMKARFKADGVWVAP